MSTRALLTGIAALFLATGTAHADQCDIWPDRPGCEAREFLCDPLPLGGTLNQDNTTQDVTLDITLGFSNNRERHLRGDELVIRYNFRTDKLWINGKQCKWSK